MAVFLSLILSLVLALLCMVIPWETRQVKTWQVMVVFGISIVLWVLGAAFSLGWYPWTNIVVFLVAVGAGMLLGRVIPAKFWPFLIFLIVMSLLDVAQIVLTTHTSAPAAQHATVPAGELYANFFLQFPWGKYNIGIFDLLLMATIGVYWRRQNGEFLVAFAGVAIGLIVAYAVLYVHPGVILPLIPLLTLGWLCSAGMYRSREQSKSKDRRIARAE